MTKRLKREPFFFVVASVMLMLALVATFSCVHTLAGHPMDAGHNHLRIGTIVLAIGVTGFTWVSAVYMWVEAILGPRVH